LRSDGKRVELSPQGVRLLHYLALRADTLVSREDCYQLLWPGGSEVDMDRGLNTLVRQVRIALGDSATEPRFIRTYPRRGYRFVAVLTPASEASSVAEPNAPVVGPIMGHVTAAPRPPRVRSRVAVASLLVAAIAITAISSLAGTGPGRDGEYLPAQAREALALAAHLLQQPGIGDKLRAEPLLLEAMSAAPASRRVRAHLAEVRLWQGRRAEAAALVSFDPRDRGLDPHEAFMAGNLQLLAGRDVARAHALLRRAVADAPDDARYQVGYAFALVVAGQSAEARDWVRRAYENDPVAAAVQADAGHVLLYAGDARGAANACGAALVAEPAFAAAAECLLTASRLLGDTASASATARRLLALNGDPETVLGDPSSPPADQLRRYDAWRAAAADLAALRGPLPDPLTAAAAWATVGRSKDAVLALNQLAGAPRSFQHLVVATDPRLAGLRECSCFEGLLERLGNPAS
jgi:Flp pilus assembly protein TadD